MSFDSWGVSFGVSWGSSWFHPDAAPPVVPTTPIGGGGIPYQSPRSRKDISRARKRLGLEDEEYRKELALQVIKDVAKRQVEKLELDKHKQFEELSREIRLNKLEWEGRYLQDLNVERERLIDLEISARLKAKILKTQQDDEEVMMLMLMALHS